MASSVFRYFLNQAYTFLGSLSKPSETFVAAIAIAALSGLVSFLSVFVVLTDLPINLDEPVFFLAFLVPFTIVFVISFVLLHGFSLLSQHNKTLRKEVDLDDLTRLSNRASFFRRGQLVLAQAHVNQEKQSLLLLDIDFFKEVNDKHGHLAGDKALSHIADVFRLISREHDFVARWGGEEFAILLHNAGERGAFAFAERLREAVAVSPVYWENQPIYITLSIGVTEFYKDDQSFDSVVMRADKALYLAKNAGRNKVYVSRFNQPVPADEKETIPNSKLA